MNRYFLKISQLTYRTDQFCLGRLDLEVEAGEYLMLTGSTGSGKTMLLELLAGLRQPSEGGIFYNGTDITKWPPERRMLGFAYQDSLLYPFLSVRDNILFGAKIRGRAKEEAIRDYALNLVEMMGLTNLLDRSPRMLSGGEKQRVSLARALLMRPPLLLLDEPLSALDIETKRNLRELLKQLHMSEKMTVLHVTHDLEDVAQLGMRTVRLERGKLISNN